MNPDHDGPFDWIDCGPPYGDVTDTPEWSEPAERTTVTTPPDTPDRYVSLALDSPATVIYDQTETEAWIQSTVAVQPADAVEVTTHGSSPDPGDRSPE